MRPGARLALGNDVAIMLTTLKALPIVALLLSSASTATGQVSAGVTIGPPPPPRMDFVPPVPGPDYQWVDGYWYPQGQKYKWHPGYWTRPPYRDAYWVEPYHDGHRYHSGYWDGSRGRVAHNHRWDADARRDERREPRDHPDEHHDNRR